jgi:hypothetical protein
MSLRPPRFELGYGRKTPQCQACHDAELALEALAELVTEGHCFCPACGHAIRVRAADDLCRAIDPHARFMVGETSLGPGEQQVEARTTPILFACMGCGGGLRVDGTSRAVTCQYCEASNYLPDGLWQQLAPVPKSHAFFLVCDFDADAPAARRSLFDTPELEAPSKTTGAAELARLADDPATDVRRAVAGDPRTPPHVLARLVDDRDGAVVRAVASNRATPFEVALALAARRDADVTRSLLENPELDEEIVERIASSNDPRDRSASIGHSNLTLATLHRLAHDDDDDEVKRAANERLIALRDQGVDVDAGRGFFRKLFGD